MKFDLSDPIAHIIEGVFARAIIGENNAHCALVIGLSDSAEALLTCCVPNLQFHVFSIYLDRLDLKVDAYT